MLKEFLKIRQQRHLSQRRNQLRDPIRHKKNSEEAQKEEAEEIVDVVVNLINFMIIGQLKNLLNLNWRLQDKVMNKNKNRNLKRKRRKLPILKNQRNPKTKPLNHLQKNWKISYFNKKKSKKSRKLKISLSQRFSRRMSIQMISWQLWWEVPNYPKSKMMIKRRKSNRKELQLKELCNWMKKNQRKNKRLHSQQTTSKKQALLAFTTELLNK